jgi:hypothetical protein
MACGRAAPGRAERAGMNQPSSGREAVPAA